MKKLTFFFVVPVSVLWALTAGNQVYSYEWSMRVLGDTRTTLTIKSDGSCILTNELTQPRSALEQQITAWEFYRKQQESAGEDDEPNTPPRQPEPKTYTTEQLAAKVREQYESREEFSTGVPVKVAALDIQSNSVRVVTTSAFPSLKDLASKGLWNWSPVYLGFENARFEMDTNRQFRITFEPGKYAARTQKTASRQWKQLNFKTDWKLVLPGKILSSGLPQTQDNATWLTLDAEKPEILAAGIKLMTQPLVIIAEPGGLKLDEVLDTKKLSRNLSFARQSEPEVPVTDAGPGFVAESENISITTVHYFPEGEKFYQDQPIESYGRDETPGVRVGVKLFPPKGRVIKRMSELRVRQAIDDRGRVIPGASDEGEDAESYRDYSFSEEGGESRRPVNFDLRLGLPAPDAQAIDELQAEAEALTLGGWKELALTNIQADAKKEIDLGEVLPEAKMIITKVTTKNQQTMIEARLEGPAAIHQLESKLKFGGSRHNSSHMHDRQPAKNSGGKTIRQVTIQGYQFEPRPDVGAARQMTLVMRYPQDVKRERIRFKLTALDLF